MLLVRVLSNASITLYADLCLFHGLFWVVGASLIIISFYKGFLTCRAGYVCSHTCVDLLNDRMVVRECDNFCNSYHLALARLKLVAGKKPTLLQGDILYSVALKLLCILAVPHLP